MTDAQRPTGPEYLFQRLSLCKFHDDVAYVVVLAHVVYGDDVGVCQLGGRTRLALEGLSCVVLGAQDLDGHSTIQCQVLCFVDVRHGTFTLQ